MPPLPRSADHIEIADAISRPQRRCRVHVGAQTERGSLQETISVRVGREQ